MDHLNKTIGQIRARILLLSATVNLIIALIFVWMYHNVPLNAFLLMGLFILAVIMGALIIGWAAGYASGIPLKGIGDAIMHISPSQNMAAPKTDKLKIGRAYVSSLSYHLYQVASLQDNKILAEHKREATQASNILSHLPLPIFVFNKEQVVTFGSDSALAYCNLESSELFGKSLFEAVDLEFANELTLEKWISDCQQNKATDSAYWQRVRIRPKSAGGKFRQCDMAAYYGRDNSKGIEFIVTLFDRTKEYDQDDKSLSFVALAVHELRTPLTIMRGYIEVFEEELEGKLDDEMAEFMRRLHGAAQQLSAFVSNILNVARIEENQLSVKLTEVKWNDIVRHAGSDMELRAKSLGKQITYDIATDLPAAAADSLTIYEVVSNLLDNAIKYSGKSKIIEVKSYTNKIGLIETTVHDSGIGIPTSVIPTLFEKFQRNHRNMAQISGSGLGLYLCKVIVNAHGGEIWVQSKEGEGTTVGFTLYPYAQLADELKSSNNKDDMVRTAHGWIKNHSMYRR